MTPKRELTIPEAEKLRELIGNAHDESVRDFQRCRRLLLEALFILDHAGYPLNRG